MIRVAVSILNYNHSKNTIACVQSLLDACRAESSSYVLDIFVADNGSANDDQLHLRQSLAELPGVYLRVNSENQGFAAGHNNNLKAIFLHSSPDYIWILNNDCLVNEDTVVSLIKSAQRHPDVGIWGATMLEMDGETIQCAGGCFYNSFISSYRQYGSGKGLAQIDQLKAVEFDYINGASLFFPLATLQTGLRAVRSLPVKGRNENQQWLNEIFFLYFEELDLAKRLEPGLGMAWCKSALIKHEGSVSTNTSDEQRMLQAEYHSSLSALKFTRLYYPRRLWFMAPVRYISKCVLLIVKGDFHLLAPITKAYRDYWTA